MSRAYELWHKERKYLAEMLGEDNNFAHALNEDTLDNAVAVKVAMLILMNQHYVTDSANKLPVKTARVAPKPQRRVRTGPGTIYPDDILLNVAKQLDRLPMGFSHIYESIIYQMRAGHEVPRHFLSGLPAQ